jgi:hypothetical protein
MASTPTPAAPVPSRLPVLLSLLLLAALLGGWWWNQERGTASTKDAEPPRRSAQLMDGRVNADHHREAKAGPRDFRKEVDAVLFLATYRTREPLDAFMREWAAVNPDAAFQWTLDHKHDQLWKPIMEIVVKADFQKAKEMFAKMEVTPGKSAAAEVFYQEWAKTDPEAALQAIADNEDEWHKGTMPAIVIGEVARQDIPHALVLLESLAGTSNPFQGGTEIAREWSKRDLPAALAWSESLPSPERDWTMRTILPTWVETEPKAAMDYLITHFQPPPEDLFDSIRILAKADPQSASRWLNESGHQTSPLARHNLYAGTILANPDEAAAFLSSIEGPMKDHVAVQVIDDLSATNPEIAGRLAEKIGNPSIFGYVGKDLLREWAPSQPEAAAAWISSVMESGAHDRYVEESLIEAYLTHAPTAHLDLGVRLLNKLEESHRLKVSRELGPLWLHLDEAKGRQMLTGLGISDEEIVVLQKKIHEPQDGYQPK